MAEHGHLYQRVIFLTGGIHGHRIVGRQRSAQQVGQQELGHPVALLLVHQVLAGKIKVARHGATVPQIKLQLIHQPEMSGGDNLVGQQRVYLGHQRLAGSHLLLPVHLLLPIKPPDPLLCISETFGVIVGPQQTLRQLSHLDCGMVTLQKLLPLLLPERILRLHGLPERLCRRADIVHINIIRPVETSFRKSQHTLIQCGRSPLHHRMEQVFEINLQTEAVARRQIQTRCVIAKRKLAHRPAERHAEREGAVFPDRSLVHRLLTGGKGYQHQLQFLFIRIDFPVQDAALYHSRPEGFVTVGPKAVEAAQKQTEQKKQRFHRQSYNIVGHDIVLPRPGRMQQR